MSDPTDDGDGGGGKGGDVGDGGGAESPSRADASASGDSASRGVWSMMREMSSFSAVGGTNPWMAGLPRRDGTAGFTAPARVERPKGQR